MRTDNQNTWQLRSKLWLEVNGHPVIGEGRMAMLEAIDRHGSIKQASLETGIAYRKMRGAIREMESILGRSMVMAFRGGKDQGGANLTAEAHELMAFYTKLADSLQKEMDTRFQEFFG